MVSVTVVVASSDCDSEPARCSLQVPFRDNPHGSDRAIARFRVGNSRPPSNGTSMNKVRGPRLQRSTRVGLSSASGSRWHELLLQMWNFSVANPFFFRDSNWAQGLSSSENPDFGKRRSCICRRASRSVFAIPNPPARGLPQDHSWRFVPPVCTGAVVVSGPDARSQESGQSCAHELAQCAPDCLLVLVGAGPLSGALLGDGAS